MGIEDFISFADRNKDRNVIVVDFKRSCKCSLPIFLLVGGVIYPGQCRELSLSQLCISFGRDVVLKSGDLTVVNIRLSTYDIVVCRVRYLQRKSDGDHIVEFVNLEDEDKESIKEKIFQIKKGAFYKPLFESS